MTTNAMLEALANAEQMVAVEDEATVAWSNDPGALASAAAYYAGIGWPVFPIAPGAKRPLTSRGFHSASTDAGTVAAWWRGCPDANIGIATGHAFDVLDIDPPNPDGTGNGFASLAELRTTWAELGVPMPDVLAIVATGSGGRHFYVPVHPTATIGEGFAPGLDYRGKGGYVIAPPSRLEHGARYSWVIKPAQFGGAS